MDTFDLDTVISPKEITSNIILRYVKAMNDFYGCRLKSLYRMVDNKIEALEFTVSEKSNITNIPLRNIKLKENLLIACIVRNGKSIIPSGSNEIKNGDNIIIVTTNLGINDLNDIVD